MGFVHKKGAKSYQNLILFYVTGCGSVFQMCSRDSGLKYSLDCYYGNLKGCSTTLIIKIYSLDSCSESHRARKLCAGMKHLSGFHIYALILSATKIKIGDKYFHVFCLLVWQTSAVKTERAFIGSHLQVK